jgi:hypothetical protein
MGFGFNTLRFGMALSQVSFGPGGQSWLRSLELPHFFQKNPWTLYIIWKVYGWSFILATHIWKKCNRQV